MMNQRWAAFFLGCMTLFSSLFCTGTSLSILNHDIGYAYAITDQESGLQYLNARYYDAKLMRFVSWDTMPLLNRFAYAQGNPLMNEDQSGHSAIPILQGLGLAGNAMSLLYAWAERLKMLSFWSTLGIVATVVSFAITQQIAKDNKIALWFAIGSFPVPLWGMGKSTMFLLHYLQRAAAVAPLPAAA